MNACEFDWTDYEDQEDIDEPWHYTRTCEFCSEVWAGLHCPHDGYQNPCPGCGRRPTVLSSEECP